MSDKEAAKINELEHKVEQINVAICGDESLGIPGIVKMLQGHIDQSKKNNENFLKEFKTFKRDLVMDYSNDFNRVDEKISWTDGRVKVLEEIDRNSTKKTGFIAGLAAAAAIVVTNFDRIIKFFTD